MFSGSECCDVLSIRAGNHIAGFHIANVVVVVSSALVVVVHSALVVVVSSFVHLLHIRLSHRIHRIHRSYVHGIRVLQIHRTYESGGNRHL